MNKKRISLVGIAVLAVIAVGTTTVAQPFGDDPAADGDNSEPG